MHIELTKEYIDNFIDVIEQKDSKKLMSLMRDLHAVDIAEIYDVLSIEQAKFTFLLIENREKAADVLAELDDDDRERFLKVLPSKVIAERFIKHMDSDDAADVIADMPEERQEEVIQHIDDLEHAGDIVDLMTYSEDTAGGLMGKEIVDVNLELKIEDAIAEIRKQAEEIDKVYYVYVVDDDGILKGALSLRRLILAHPEQKVKDIQVSDIVKVKADMPAEEVANLSDKYDLVALPVVDTIGRLLGQITFDDLVDIMREEAEKDYQMMTGISEDIEQSDSIWVQTRARLPWLLIGLIGGVFGSRVIGFFEIELAQNASMAFFIPLIAGMGGNVGVQSSSIVVQGLAGNSVSYDSTFKKILKELSVASINAIVLSSLVFSYNYFFSDSFALTVSVSTALFIVIIFASIFGTFIPLLLNYLKIDPALATGPFITTTNDIVGLLIYLSIGGVLFAIL